jgi:hypothetical protein
MKIKRLGISIFWGIVVALIVLGLGTLLYKMLCWHFWWTCGVIFVVVFTSVMYQDESFWRN